MPKDKQTYTGDQYDDIEENLHDAGKLLAHPNTRREGMELIHLAEAKMKREMQRLIYARITGQRPNIPPLEPALIAPKLLSEPKDKPIGRI